MQLHAVISINNFLSNSSYLHSNYVKFKFIKKKLKHILLNELIHKHKEYTHEERRVQALQK
jgi:hypothetical protein